MYYSLSKEWHSEIKYKGSAWVFFPGSTTEDQSQEIQDNK